MLDFSQLRKRLNAMLFISAVYFIIWGTLVLVFPRAMDSLLVETANTNLIFWDLIAVVTVILGLGLLVAAFDPYRNWLIMFVNLLFHLAVIIGYSVGWSKGVFSNTFLPFLFFNHLIWLVPLGLGLYALSQRRFQNDRLLIDTFNEEDYPLDLFETVSGKNLQEMSDQNPVLLVFLRHFGCPFCQETLVSMQSKRSELEAKGIQVVLVYMASPAVGHEYLSQYGLDDIEQLSDPESIAYKRFQITNGTLGQLLGVKVLARQIWLAVVKKMTFTKVEGDIQQMPGMLMLHNGRIVRQYLYRTIADRPNYDEFLSYKD